MPTRPQLWRFRSIYEDFEHAGLRTEVDRDRSTPLDGVGRAARIDGYVVDEHETRVGEFTRMLARGEDGLRVRHENIELAPHVRGRGFGRALHEHAEAVYRRMEVAYVTMHAEHVGSLLWPRLGFDFDLRRLPGAGEREQRRAAVLKLLAPDARKVKDLPRPAELLETCEAGDDPARRAAALRLREQLTGGVLLDPIAIAAFDADGTGLGRELLLGASFDAIKRLD